MAVYFAYGSNLDWENWSQFCSLHNADPHCMKLIGSALLPDFELVFNYRSVLREGGALNIRASKGQVVHGVLFEVDERGWEVLDLKESVADGCYVRTKSAAITQGGATVPIVTYVVTPERTENFVAPSDEYIEIVLRGLAAHRLQTDLFNRVARDLPAQPQVDGVFVYGTLMRRESRFGAIRKHGPVQTLHAHTCGRLHETAADYPMLDLICHGSDDLVRGEFLRFRDLSAVLETLDEVEAFSGYTSQCNEYVRTLVDVDAGETTLRRAWTYAVGNRTAMGRRIESGCWRTFRGVRSPDTQFEQVE